MIGLFFMLNCSLISIRKQHSVFPFPLLNPVWSAVCWGVLAFGEKNVPGATAIEFIKAKILHCETAIILDIC